MIISGAASQTLAVRLAATLDEPLAPVEYDRFPDGELYVRLGETATDRAVIVASTVSSDAHIELLELQDAAREAGIEQVTTVLPYMGYARQDKAFKRGEPVSARALARAIDTGTDRVITVNPHEPGVREFFDPPATIVDAAPQLAGPLPEELTAPVFLAPDTGATSLARSVRDRYGTGTIDAFEKTRETGDTVQIEPSEIDVAGHDVVIVDDIIATGSTMSAAIEALTDRGARRVFVVCVHAVFVNDARSKLARAGIDGLYATDTIERAASTVSAAPAIATALRTQPA